jgi:hypothetical protein
MDNCVSCNLVICVFRACCYVEEDNVFFGFSCVALENTIIFLTGFWNNEY